MLRPASAIRAQGHLVVVISVMSHPSHIVVTTYHARFSRTGGCHLHLLNRELGSIARALTNGVVMPGFYLPSENEFDPSTDDFVLPVVSKERRSKHFDLPLRGK